MKADTSIRNTWAQLGRQEATYKFKRWWAELLMVTKNCCPFSFSFPPVPRTSASERPAHEEIRLLYVLQQCRASHTDGVQIAAG